MSDHLTNPAPNVDPPEAADTFAQSSAETGHPAVDAALAALAQVRHAPPAEQLPAFQALHRTLQETLASIDEQ
ncbi:MAG TPA: hypothetical protein VKZ67_15485 [Natronosporangium sp.]|jgi:hypothetical protein|nr:hypothetical protein [Natronosporangium sp.]